MEENKYLERPWLKEHELLGAPETLEPYPDMRYTEYHLDRPARRYPNQLALVQFDYEMKYKELKDHVDRLATALADLGIKKGDVVATVLPTSIQGVLADLAIPEIGGICTLQSVIDSVDGLVDKWTRAGVKTVICCHTNVKDRDVLDKVKEASGKVGVENIIVTKTEDYSMSPPIHEEEEGIIWLTDLIKKYPPNPPKVDIDPKNDAAVLFFTGGTTGIPKGVMLSHKGLVAQSEAVMNKAFSRSLVKLMEGLGRAIIPLPLFHVYGHGETLLCLSIGLTALQVTDPRDTKEFVRLVKKYHPVLCIGAPTQFWKLLKEEEAKDFGMIYISGSAALAPEIHKSVEEKTGSIMGEGYGLSEFAPVTHVPSVVSMLVPILGSRENVGKVLHIGNRLLDLPGMDSILKTVKSLIGSDNFGRLANILISFGTKNIVTTEEGRKKELVGSIGIPCVDLKVKIIDEDTGEVIPISRVVKEGLRGEMCLDAPWKMLGYWPDVGSGMDGEGYVHSGDVVKIDEWGHFYVVDRTKDMVNVSGYKVYTREMDDLLYEYPGVDEVAVVGIPDPERPGSERVKAFIVLKPEYRGKIKEDDIVQYLKERVPPYAVPKSVEFRDEELPRTITEKIFKRKLRDEEIKKMKKQGLLK